MDKRSAQSVFYPIQLPILVHFNQLVSKNLILKLLLRCQVFMLSFTVIPQLILITYFTASSLYCIVQNFDGYTDSRSGDIILFNDFSHPACTEMLLAITIRGWDF